MSNKQILFFQPLKRPHVVGRLVAVAVFGICVAWLFSRMIWTDEQGLWVGHEHCWSDYPFQIGIIQRVVHLPASEWMDSHPLVADQRLRYPMLSSIISAFLLRAGANLQQALVWPFVVMFVLLAWLLYELYRKCGLSPGAALSAMAFFYFSSGPGFWDWGGDINSFGWSAVTYPPRPYTRIDEYQWYSGNFLSGMLIPQRSFLPGLILGLGVVMSALRLIQSSDINSLCKNSLMIASILVGKSLLVATHIHSVIAVGAILAMLASAQIATRPRDYTFLSCVVLAAVCALIMYSWLYGFNSGEITMTKISPWWGETGLVGWFVMWWRLWAVFLPAVIVGVIFWLYTSSRTWPDQKNLLALFYSGLFLFVQANVVLLQPISWDNSKVFLWVYLLWSPVVGWLVMRLTQANLAGKCLAILLFASLTATGVSEIIRMLHVDNHQYLILSVEDQMVGEWISKNTATDAVFLTSPVINSPPMTSGARSLFLGFTGWMPNFGVNPVLREKALRRAFSGDFSGVKKFCKGRELFIFYGSQERRDFPLMEQFAGDNIRLVYQSNKLRIYRIL